MDTIHKIVEWVDNHFLFFYLLVGSIGYIFFWLRLDKVAKEILLAIVSVVASRVGLNKRTH